MRNVKTSTKIWCVVAELVDNGLGSRHFSTGSPVYCFPVADDHGIIKVVGQHRTTQRYLTVFVHADQLTNWQVETVEYPPLIREFEGNWDDSEASRARAEYLVNYLRSRHN